MSRDLFEKCFKNEGNFRELNNESDHYLMEPQLSTPVSNHMVFQNKRKIIWSVNNYIGMAGHPEVTEVARQALDKWGMSSPMGSRLMTGDTPEHIKLEENLAAFCQKPSALLCSFGYLGVLGIIASLVGRGDTILLDNLSHACIVDGAILAQAKSGMRIRPYAHNDMNDLEEQLKIVQAQNTGGILIVTEGVFGMHGDLGNLPDICALKEKYHARLFVDDAHGIGVMGKNGRGTGEHFNVQDKIDLYFGTFSKAFALLGGTVAGHKEVINYLKFNSRTSIFSRSLPQVLVQSITKALEILCENPSYRENMWKIARALQTGLKDIGYDLGNTGSPITPIHIHHKDTELAITITHELRDQHDIFVTPVVYPVIQKGLIIFRLIPTAIHTEEDVSKTLKAFKLIRKKYLI